MHQPQQRQCCVVVVVVMTMMVMFVGHGSSCIAGILRINDAQRHIGVARGGSAQSVHYTHC